MAKKRTRAQKTKLSGFRVEFGAMDGAKVDKRTVENKQINLGCFRSDLTKIVVLTMLALASEAVLWLILKH